MGLLWSNISFSEIIKFNCKDINTNADQGSAKITYVIDTSNNVFTVEIQYSADEIKKYEEKYKEGVITKDMFEKVSGIVTLNTEVLKVNGKTITYHYSHQRPHYVKEFNYEKNYFIDYQINKDLSAKKPYVSCGTKPDEPDEEVYKSLIEKPIIVEKPKKKKIAKKESTEEEKNRRLKEEQERKRRADDASKIQIENESVETNTVKKLKSLNACKKCNLQGANLRRAKLSDAILIEANLREAKLSDAFLFGANLTEANLAKADLIQANLREAKLYKANLSQAKLMGAILIEANLSKADLSGANLSRAYLREADLIGANLDRAKLSGADLIQANLRKAILIEADLSGARLDRADLALANLSQANLSGANLYSANLSKADLSGANLSGANLKKADLSGATFCNTITPWGIENSGC